MPQSRTTHTEKPSLMNRLRGRNRPVTTVTTTTVEKTTLPAGTTTHSTRERRGIMGRRQAPRHNAAVAPSHHHHQRRPSLGDKISNAMLKLRGTLTRRPGLKAAGTRRAHGTDGRGARRYY